MSASIHVLGGPTLLRFDRYQVVRKLGAGAMAEVFEVEHGGLGKRFALKVLRHEHAQSARAMERFEQEGRTLARLHSPHIVSVVDSGKTDAGLPFFVMELLGGGDLRTLLAREGVLPVRRAVHLALDLCQALEAAHAAGVVHRDLKPENVLITQDAEGRETCKLLDFGVAKSEALAITRDDALIGTARYMAPEQFAGEGGVGPRSDLFALGVILFECLVGRPPFDGDRMERILFRILHEPAPALGTLRPELPAALSALVNRALQKEASARPASAAEFARTLRALIEPERVSTRQQTLGDEDALVVATATPVNTPVPSAPKPKRSVLWPLLITLAVGVAIGLAVARRPFGVAEPRAEPVTAPAPAAAAGPAAPAIQVEPVMAPAPATPAATPQRAHQPRRRRRTAPAAAPVPAPALAPAPATKEPERPALFFPSVSP